MQTAALALELGVVGLMNVQYALQQTADGEQLYVLEVNPRGSRTVPFVSKATGVSLAKVATQVIAGHQLRDLDLPGWDEALAGGRVPRKRHLRHVAVKEAVLPFPRFPGVDTTLGPEMKSTGEVMGVGTRASPWPSRRRSWPPATACPGRARCSSPSATPTRTPPWQWPPRWLRWASASWPPRARTTPSHATASPPSGSSSTRKARRCAGLVLRAEEAERALATGGDPVVPGGEGRSLDGFSPLPTIVDLIEGGEVDLVVNTPRGRGARADGYEIRRAALRRGIPAITTIAAAQAVAQAIEAAREGAGITVNALQDLHPELAIPRPRRAVAVGAVVRPSACRPGRVVRGERVGSFFVLELDVPGWVPGVPGQFAMVRPERSARFLPRALQPPPAEGRAAFLSRVARRPRYPGACCRGAGRRGLGLRDRSAGAST